MDQLNDAEQMQIRLNAATEKGGQFAGAAAEFLRTSAGQMQIVDGQLKDLTTDVGTAILASMEYRDMLREVSNALDGLGISADDVVKNVKAGITIQQIAQEEADKFRWRDRALAAVNLPLTDLYLAKDLVAAEGLDTTISRFQAANDPGAGRQDEIQARMIKDQQDIKKRDAVSKLNKDAQDAQLMAQRKNALPASPQTMSSTRLAPASRAIPIFNHRLKA